jgi:signal transduction histidine kinase
LQAADRNLKLRFTLPDPDLYVIADPRRLRQVLLHLIDTLIAQMTEGSIQVSVKTAVETEYAHIWIDTDCPINLSEPIDQLQMTSEPAAALPSPGLNLLTTQILVSLMQGTLTVVEAAGDEQMRLQCTLPLVLPEPIA